MSTPETRAMQWLQLGSRRSSAVPAPSRRIRYGLGPRPPTGGVGPLGSGPCVCTCVCLRRAKFCGCRGCGRASALALLVARVVADDHDPPVTADHPALVADLLDARLDLHGIEVLRVSATTPPSTGCGQDLLVAVDDPATRQVVRRQLHHDPVVREDADVVHAHLAADVCQDLVAVLELDLEHGVRQRLDDSALDLDGTLLLGHASPFESTTLIGPARI